MQTELTREEARASLRRWQLVRTRQREEARRMSVEEKFRRLALLMRFRVGLADPCRAKEKREISGRWRRLRESQLAR